MYSSGSRNGGRYDNSVMLLGSLFKSFYNLEIILPIFIFLTDMYMCKIYIFFVLVNVELVNVKT